MCFTLFAARSGCSRVSVNLGWQSKATRGIVFRHVSGPRFEMTVTLAEHGGRTKLTWRTLFESAVECEKVKKFAVDANEQNFDRLEAQLVMLA
jgi:hypothetical protein